MVYTKIFQRCQAAFTSIRVVIRIRHAGTVTASGNWAECSHVNGYKARLVHVFILFRTWPGHAGWHQHPRSYTLYVERRLNFNNAPMSAQTDTKGKESQ